MTENHRLSVFDNWEHTRGLAMCDVCPTHRPVTTTSSRRTNDKGSSSAVPKASRLAATSGPSPVAVWPRYIDRGQTNPALEGTRYQRALNNGVPGRGICRPVAADTCMAKVILTTAYRVYDSSEIGGWVKRGVPSLADYSRRQVLYREQRARRYKWN